MMCSESNFSNKSLAPRSFEREFGLDVFQKIEFKAEKDDIVFGKYIVRLYIGNEICKIYSSDEDSCKEYCKMLYDELYQEVGCKAFGISYQQFRVGCIP